MPTKDSSVKGLRLADSLWREIDVAAEQAQETRNEWIAKRIPWLLSRAREVGNSDEIASETAQGVWG